MIMKKIFNIMVIIAAAAALWSCNKAEYITAKFVTFNANKYSFNEDAGIVAIPLSIYGADECTVAFSATDGTAVQGTDFTIVDKNGEPNTAGVAKVCSDASKSDSIYVKLNYNPAMTKGKSFTLSLVSSATEGVVVSGTKQCDITINDLEYAVSQYYGSWSNEATKDADKIAFDLEEYDIAKDEDKIAEYYPEACVKIPAGDNAVILGTEISWYDIYGYYDSTNKTINLYPEQPYVAYSFGEAGNFYLGLENGEDATKDVIFSTGDKVITFSASTVIRMYTYPAFVRSYTYETIPAGTTLKKQ